MNPEQLTELTELSEERDFLLRSIADLDREHDAGDVTDDDYRTLRDDYTTRAATVLRSLEGGCSKASARRTLPRNRVLLGVLASVALVGVIGALLLGSAGDRRAGDTITGGPVSTDPNSLLVEARSKIASDPGASLDLFKRVLEQEPDNVEARTYAGWVIAFDAMSSGTQGDELRQRGELALQLIDAARRLDPTYVDAQCFTAIIEYRFLDDAAAAAEPLSKCRQGDLPAEVAPLVEQLGAKIDAALDENGTTATSTVP